MSKRKSQAGFTLIELVVSIACAAIVSAAAISLMYLGSKIFVKANNSVENQQNASVVLELLEDLANSGEIKDIEAEGDGWSVISSYSDDDEVIPLTYDVDAQTISTGNGNNVVLENVAASDISYDQENALLELSITIDDDTYSTSVYCRTSDVKEINYSYTLSDEEAQEAAGNATNGYIVISITIQDSNGNETTGIYEDEDGNGSGIFTSEDGSTFTVTENDDGTMTLTNGDGSSTVYEVTEISVGSQTWTEKSDTEDPDNGEGSTTPDPEVSDIPSISSDDLETISRVEFLYFLLNEYGSDGTIQHVYNEEDLQYVGETYSLWYCGGEYWDGWDEDTPWCAIFISWALDQLPEGSLSGDTPKYSSVESWVNYLLTNNGSGTTWSYSVDSDIQMGDLIVFDWQTDGDPDHIGIVLYVSDGYVYTIEGNSSDTVCIRAYSTTDSRIYGYGSLNWATGTSSETGT